MKADYLNYQRATAMSLLGLTIQLVLGLALLVYAVLHADRAAETAAIYMLLGVPAWGLLAIIFDQHRRERIEALEAETYAASDAAGSSVFERSGEDLRVAERRLRLVYRWIVPTVSLLLAGAMIAVGIIRLDGARAGLENFKAVDNRGWPMGLGFGIAFIAFVFARYVAVMARQKVWAPLRAGAGFAVGSAVMAFFIAVGHLVDIAGPDTVLRSISIAFPVVILLLGVEIVLNFLLDVYRPRKPGEWPRPAMESRILGFLAAPDQVAASIGEAINYQFGYDVASSWFYRLISRVLLRILVPIALVVLWAMSSLVVVRPHQQAVVERTGAFSRVIGPGLHFKYPWPFERITIPEYVVRDARGKVTFRSQTVTGVRTLNIGSVPSDGTGPILWTNEHALEEVFFLVQPALGADTPVAGGGIGLAQMAVEFPIHYSIDDLEAYERLAPPELRDELIKAVAQRELTKYLTAKSVGDLLSTRRNEISAELLSNIEKALIAINPLKNGKPVVKLIFGGITGMHPPQDASRAFEGVVVAQQKYNARVKNAEALAVETLSRSVGSVALADRVIAELDVLAKIPATLEGKPNPAYTQQRLKIRGMLTEAGGAVAATLAGASADRWERHMGERGRLWAFQGLVGAYRAGPELFRAGVYFDALRAAIANARLFLVDKGVQLELQFDGQDKDSVQTIFDTQNTNQ